MQHDEILELRIPISGFDVDTFIKLLNRDTEDEDDADGEVCENMIAEDGSTVRVIFEVDAEES